MITDKRILIVDDDYICRKVLQFALKSIGVQSDQACNGSEAVELASKHNYDLILSDFNMPGLNGFEAVSKMREKQVQTPVWLITGCEDIYYRSRELSTLGIDKCYLKPYDLDDVLKKIQEFVN